MTNDNSHTPRTRDDILKLAAEIGIIKQDNFTDKELMQIVINTIYPAHQRPEMIKKFEQILVCQK